MPAKINKIIKILISSDLMYQIGAGFVAPVFAVFLLDSIQGGTLELVGTATAIYWVTKSIVRLPVAYFLDKKKGENDDYYSLLTGFFIITACYFLYLIAKTPAHIYAIQLISGIGGAFAFTPWYGFFSRHIDRNHENLEWGLEVSLVGFGISGAGFAAGFIADKFGFKPIFIIAGTLSLIAGIILAFIGRNLKIKKEDGLEVKERDESN